jgi:mycothiol maleylpyruvate isomerase-like protein
VINRSREAEAFLEAAGTTAPDAISSCAGWTTHEVTAHVTGIAVEVNRHLDPFLQGDPVPTTRSFEEREAPLQAMGHDDLLLRLDAEEERMRRLIATVLADGPDAVIPWTGRLMAVAKFIPHLRNEHALHRWDITGDDEVGLSLLSQSDLTEHSVEVLGRILLAAGRSRDPDPDTDFCVRLHSDGERDLFVVVDDGVATLTWDEPVSVGLGLDCDAAARQLLIWGRRPDARGRLHSHLAQSQLARLQVLLSGY